MKTTATLYGTPGLGHQLLQKKKAYEACKDSLAAAYSELVVLNQDTSIMRSRIHELIEECNNMAYSIEESLNQDI